MNLRYFILVMLVGLFSCHTSEGYKIESTYMGYYISDVQFVGNENFEWTFHRDTCFTPTISEVELADSLIQAHLNELHRDKLCQNYKNISKNYTKYLRQYVGMYGINGERLINVDAVMSGFLAWTSPYSRMSEKLILSQGTISIYDGGADVWSTTIDVKNKSIVRFNINGLA